MLAFIVQFAVIGVWGTMLAVHTRRLLRLAQAQAYDSLRKDPLKVRIDRVWWWLGREEFWRKVQLDCVRCVELTLMLFLFAWNFVR